MKRAQYRSLAHYLDQTGTRQEDFAARLGVRQGYISRAARGLLVPRAARAARICELARCPLDSFIREKNKRQANNSQK